MAAHEAARDRPATRAMVKIGERMSWPGILVGDAESLQYKQCTTTQSDVRGVRTANVFPPHCRIGALGGLVVLFGDRTRRAGGLRGADGPPAVPFLGATLGVFRTGRPVDVRDSTDARLMLLLA